MILRALFVALAGLAWPCQAEVRSAGPYAVVAESVHAAGGLATSGVYRQVACAGEFAGSAAHAGLLAKAGFCGQLYEVASLQVTAATTTFPEQSTLQLRAGALLDDDSSLTRLEDQVIWSVITGPVGVGTDGLALAGVVHEDAPATVQADGMGASAILALMVQDVTDDRSPVTLASTDISVLRGQEEVEITLSRPFADWPVSIRVVTADGTDSRVPPFLGGQSGKDYEAVDAPVEFASGETLKTVRIPLLSGTVKQSLHTRFRVALSEPGLGARIGQIDETEVRVLLTDPGSPTITLKAPGKGTQSAAAPLLVQGVAGDSLGLERVEIRLNGGSPFLAGLESSSRATAVPFTALIEPVDGANSLVVTAYDLAGNATSLNREFLFERRHRLTLLREVPAEFAAQPDRVGEVTLAAVPAKAATSLSKTATQSFSDVVPGTEVRLTALARSGHWFSHWDGLPEGAQRQGVEVVFLMPGEEVPAVAAVFARNPLPELLGPRKGDYLGLLLPQAPTELSQAGMGQLTGKLTASTGRFSGKLTLGGVVLPFLAHWQGDGSVWFSSGRTFSDQLPFLDRFVRMSWSAQGLTVRVEGPESEVSEGVARPPFYTGSQPVPEAMLNTASRQGYYTLILPAKAQEPGIDRSKYPQGTGHAVLTLAAAGTFRMSGQLADGSRLTASSFLVSEDHAPVFVSLRAPVGRANADALLGDLRFAPGEDWDVTAADLLWFRASLLETASSAGVAYIEGWPQGLRVDAIGALFQRALPLQAMLGLQAAGESGMAILRFTAGKLVASPLVENMNIIGDRGVRSGVAWNRASGLFSGSFQPDWSSPGRGSPKFQGVILQKGPYQGGHGSFLSNRAGDMAPESGAVFWGSPSD